jgi:hypothetical protein
MHISSRLCWRNSSTVLGWGALVINHNFLDGTDLLFSQNTVPGMIGFGRQVLKSINWSLLLLLFIFQYYSIHYFKIIIIIYHYNYFIRYLVEIVQEWSYNPKFWTGSNYPFTSVIKFFFFFPAMKCE